MTIYFKTKTKRRGGEKLLEGLLEFMNKYNWIGKKKNQGHYPTNKLRKERIAHVVCKVLPTES